MSSKSKKVLVTGVAGFLGSHWSEELSKLGHKIIGIDKIIKKRLNIISNNLFNLN